MTPARPRTTRSTSWRRTTADEQHCPAIAWGLVARRRAGHDVVRVGASATTDELRRRAHRVPHRVDDEELHRRRRARAARRGRVVARRPDRPPRARARRRARPGRARRPITLRHLLSMTAGMATDDAWADRHLDISADEHRRASTPPVPVRPPPERRAYEYSNLGYGMIGRACSAPPGAACRSTSPSGSSPARHAAHHMGRARARRLGAPAPLAATTSTCPTSPTPRRRRDRADGWHLDHRRRPGEVGRVARLGQHRLRSDPSRSALSAASRREMQRMHTYIGMPDGRRRAQPHRLRLRAERARRPAAGQRGRPLRRAARLRQQHALAGGHAGSA